MRRFLVAGIALALIAASAAEAAPELSISNRLQDRRYIASSERAYAVGFQDGRFYANGWHITGEMGGVWTPPLKLVDGVWFGVDDQWIGQATEFRSGWGYTEMNLPTTAGLQLQRTDFAPDGGRAVLFGLHVHNPGAAERTVTVMVDAHSELMTAYPWGFGGIAPNAADNPADERTYDGHALVFREPAPHPNGDTHEWAALVGANRDPTLGVADDAPHRGDQGDTTCAGDDGQSMPSECDDGPFGRGKGGQLRYALTIPAGGTQTLWVAVAGSDEGLAAARAELAAALDDPQAALERKIEKRESLAARTQVTLPGDAQLAQGVDWAKQNLADSTQYAEDLEIRWVDQGKRFPPPAGELASARWVGAGFPDYPWLFATDGEYTAFPMVALGQFRAIKDHIRALRDASDIVNDRSGKVGHEFVSDGSMWFGQNADPGNTDETAKFPSTVALIWRWTGDNAFRDQMYDFAKRNMRYINRKLDKDGDGWPEGLGNVERTGMGPEKLDNTVYYIRGLYDLADMARSKGDRGTLTWAGNRARRLQERFEAAWWMDELSLHADSLGENEEQIQQKHWITVTPMEAELTVNGRPVPGLTTFDHGTRSLALHETDCFSGEPPYNQGLFHTGCDGGPENKGERTIFGLNTAIQSVGEGNYGRLGPGEQQRYTDAETEPMFAEPWTGGTPDEQPGALPEILPSPDFDPAGPRDANIDRCWTCRAMFMQAWGHYGSVWPVVHQQLGVRPDLGRGRLAVVPQVPTEMPIEGRNIRLGSGALDLVEGSRERNTNGTTTYRTTVEVGSAPVQRLVLGHTLPRGSQVQEVRLDGSPVDYDTVLTNRGLEVLAPAPASGRRQLVVIGS
jgi:hypothetical protein